MGERRFKSPNFRRLLAAGIAVVTLGLFFLIRMALADPAPTEALAPPMYVEEADAAGVTHSYDGDYEFFVGGGVAVFDCNGDFKPELFIAGGTNRAGLYVNQSPIGGSFSFARRPSQVTDLEFVSGAYPLDVDGDGVVDLAVLRFGENVLLRGLGNCEFERANERWRFDGGNEWTAGFSARWDEGESMPTMAFGNYVDIESIDNGVASCADNALVRPDGSGFAPPEQLAPGFCSLSLLFSDWSRSGDRDLRVTNDRHYYRNDEGEEQLWHLDGSAPPRLYTREEGWNKLQIWGMGIATHDVTGDGVAEVFLTSQGDNKLQTLEDGPQQPTYEDIAIRRGVTAHRPFDGSEVFPSTAWHPEFEDVNNDGFTDLYVSKGNVEEQTDHAANDPNNLLLGQPDGTFIEAAEDAGIMNTMRTRGAALADLNLDGLLDLVEVNRRENVTMWRNVGSGEPGRPAAMGNWIALRLQQDSPNRDAVGSWLELQVGSHLISREVTVGGGHAGGQLDWIHFGIGKAGQAKLRIQWPDGQQTAWMSLDSNTFYAVERGKPAPLIWTPEEN